MFESVETLEPAPPEETPAPLSRPLTDSRGMLNARLTLDWLAEDTPGPEMLNVLTLLTSVQDVLTADERVDLLLQLDRCESWVAAQKQLVLAAIDQDAGQKEERAKRTGRYEDTELEVALGLRWSEGMVKDRLDVATELIEWLPKTWQALAEGRINYMKAHEIAQGSQKLSDAAKAGAFEERVLTNADEATFSDIRRSVADTLTRVDPEGAEERSRRTRRERRVTRRPLEDGAGHLGVTGPAAAIAAIHNAMTLGARQLKDTGQVDSLDQGRFDTLLDWAIRYLDERTIPDRSPVPVGATLIVKASTAAGHDNDPAEIAGFGPITAQTARDLLAGKPPAAGPFEKDGDRYAEEWYCRDEDALPPEEREPDLEPPPEADDLPPDDWQWQPPPTQPPANSPPVRVDPFTVAWRVLKVDPATGWAVPPSGTRMNYGTSRRFATPAQGRYVRDRDRTCFVPVCAQSGNQVEIDHRHGAAAGGPTDVCNLGPGCPHHNRTTRTQGDWKIEPSDDGTATLITPQGRRYRIKPHNYLD